MKKESGTVRKESNGVGKKSRGGDSSCSVALQLMNAGEVYLSLFVSVGCDARVVRNGVATHHAGLHCSAWREQRHGSF